ncbi:MAG: mevalonate kinase [Chloroflexi bacterium]|nr:mevalonate kinase [Chloroflexota bacterium]
MPAVSASAPGKAILFGEHAVVYQRPAIAVPVHQVQARAYVSADPRAPQGHVDIDAPDIDLHTSLSELDPQHPLSLLIAGVQNALGGYPLPALRLRITSSIPIAAGLGSGAAVSVAVSRALSNFLGRPLSDEVISSLAYQAEQVYHGTPSGIDNTVIAYARPIYFVRGQPFLPLKVAEPVTLVIADSGQPASTAQMVGGVAARWREDPARYNALFDAIGEIARQARPLIENGPASELGPLMSANHEALVELGVSSPSLDRLVKAAQQSGALGAKLSGAGGGGNMLALAPAEIAEQVAEALQQAGAVRTIVTTIPAQTLSQES